VESTGVDEREIREQAIASLKRRRAFLGHVAVWVGVSALMIVIWALTGADFFWPIFPIAGWGIGIAAQAWSIYGPGSRPFSEDAIARESERLRR
jgi:2TM domain